MLGLSVVLLTHQHVHSETIVCCTSHTSTCSFQRMYLAVCAGLVCCTSHIDMFIQRQLSIVPLTHQHVHFRDVFSNCLLYLSHIDMFISEMYLAVCAGLVCCTSHTSTCSFRDNCLLYLSHINMFISEMYLAMCAGLVYCTSHTSTCSFRDVFSNCLLYLSHFDMFISEMY